MLTTFGSPIHLPFVVEVDHLGEIHDKWVYCEVGRLSRISEFFEDSFAREDLVLKCAEDYSEWILYGIMHMTTKEDDLKFVAKPEKEPGTAEPEKGTTPFSPD